MLDTLLVVAAILKFCQGVLCQQPGMQNAGKWTPRHGTPPSLYMYLATSYQVHPVLIKPQTSQWSPVPLPHGVQGLRF
jgi:hypothetical protein